MLRFTAQDPGQTLLQMNTGLSQIVMTPTATLWDDQLDFERQTITVVPRGGATVSTTEPEAQPTLPVSPTLPEPDNTPVAEAPQVLPPSAPVAPVVPPVAEAPVETPVYYPPTSVEPVSEPAKPQADGPVSEEVAPVDPPPEAAKDTPETNSSSSPGDQGLTPPAAPADVELLPIAETTTIDALPDWFLNDRFIGPWEIIFILPPALPPAETLDELKQSAHEAIDAIFAEWQEFQATRETWLEGIEHWNERNRREVASSRLVAHLMHFLALA